MAELELYEVIQTPQAEEHLEGIVRYISLNLQNPDAARHFLDQIDEMEERLQTYPKKCRFTPEKPWNSTIRRTKVNGYSYYAYLWIDEETHKVFILGYAYTGMDQIKYLQNLLDKQN